VGEVYHGVTPLSTAHRQPAAWLTA